MNPYPKTLKAMVGRDLSFEKKTIQSYENKPLPTYTVQNINAHKTSQDLYD